MPSISVMCLRMRKRLHLKIKNICAMMMNIIIFRILDRFEFFQTIIKYNKDVRNKIFQKINGMEILCKGLLWLYKYEKFNQIWKISRTISLPRLTIWKKDLEKRLPNMYHLPKIIAHIDKFLIVRELTKHLAISI